MKRMSFSETVFLFFLALIIFGPKKLPEIARQVGKALNEFRRASNEFKAQIEQEISNLEVENRKQTILPPSPAPEGTTSRTLNPAPVAESQPSAPPAEAFSGNGSSEVAALPPAAEPAAASAPAEASAEVVAPETVVSSTSQESHV
ncbi:MAG TPA: twin-arginine translocase TatA/TatE family subunit [Verrucomicrobiae bacterium]|nr:twin-arginine translocase TatA/TatE family subunit [Verrucomicrobiae bacterium]